MPTVRVDLLDTKITLKEKGQLAESLTKVVSETLGYPDDRVIIIFKHRSKGILPVQGNSGDRNPQTIEF